MAGSSATQCVTCNARLQGAYCHACGEKAPRAAPTLLRFLGELAGEALDADGRIFKTVRTLVLRPGRLTVEYMRGRRKPYLGPAAIFVVMNVLFFFVQPLANVNTFHATLHSQTNWYPYSGWAEGVIEERLAETGATREEYAQQFDVASERYARTLIFLQVPLFALGVMLLQWAKRRYFIEHLVYSTHFFAALLLLGVMTSLGVYAYWTLEFGDSFNLELPYMLFVAGYSMLAMREVYDDGWPRAVTKALLLLLVCLVVINAYRLVLFAVTLWTVS